jgi:signal recognition particle subunit SRP54
MVCADTFRAGAFDQLKQNATKLRVPFYGSYTEADPVAIAQEGVEQFIKDKYEIIIVDTSGRHKQEGALFEEMQEISAAVRPDNTIFVMDATQGQAVYDQAMGFREAVNVVSVIVTKLDGHSKGGGALSAVAATKSPIMFLGSGEKFDDFESFNAQSFVSKLLGMGDARAFMEDMKDFKSSADKDELMKKMNKGEFTLKDMYTQFEDQMNVGTMGKLMGQGTDNEHKKRLKRFMTIMDSMTDKELDGKVDWHERRGEDNTIESRIKRVAKGSGTHPLDVKLLLQTHRQQENMVSKMGKSGMFKGNAKQKQMMENMKKNPAAMMSYLNRMDPKLLASMGGRDAVMKMMQGGGEDGAGASAAQMMQQMGGRMPGMGNGMGAMPDMASMMQNMNMGGR